MLRSVTAYKYLVRNSDKLPEILIIRLKAKQNKAVFLLIIILHVVVQTRNYSPSQK